MTAVVDAFPRQSNARNASIAYELSIVRQKEERKREEGSKQEEEEDRERILEL